MKKSASPGLLNPLLLRWFWEQCLTRAKLVFIFATIDDYEQRKIRQFVRKQA